MDSDFIVAKSICKSISYNDSWEKKKEGVKTKAEVNLS